MTTHELAAKLLEQPNIPCLTYIHEDEMFGQTEEVKFYSKAEAEDEEKGLPYSKTDQPEVGEQGVVLIQGWIAG